MELEEIGIILGRKRGRIKGRNGGKERERKKRVGNREGEKAESLTFPFKRHHQALTMKTINNFKQMLNTLVP